MAGLVVWSKVGQKQPYFVQMAWGIGTPGFTGAALFILSALLAAGVLRLSLTESTEFVSDAE